MVDKTVRNALRSCSVAYNEGLASGNMNEYKIVPYSVRRVVKKAKRHYGRKLKLQIQHGGPRSLWQALRTIIVY